MLAVTILAGLALLVAGGDLLVRGAVAVARRAGISPLVIGLTLVGFGTSTPELLVITSYSIHYTKLYEMLLWRSQTSCGRLTISACSLIAAVAMPCSVRAA